MKCLDRLAHGRRCISNAPGWWCCTSPSPPPGILSWWSLHITSRHVIPLKYSLFSWFNCGFYLEPLADLDDDKGCFPNIWRKRDSGIEIPCLDEAKTLRVKGQWDRPISSHCLEHTAGKSNFKSCWSPFWHSINAECPILWKQWLLERHWTDDSYAAFPNGAEHVVTDSVCK